MKKLLLVVLATISLKAWGDSLHHACQSYDPLMVKKAIQSGAKLNELGDNQQTPLLYVCSFSFYSKLAINYAEQLLRAGAHVNCQNNKGDTALHVACSHYNNHLVFLLLEYGANVHIKNKQGSTALHIACENNEESVKYLLAFGAKIHIRDNKGRTPLHIASEYGKKSIVKVLLQHGADVSAVDNNGHTPADICCKNFEDEEKTEKADIIYLLQNYKNS